MRSDHLVDKNEQWQILKKNFTLPRLFSLCLVIPADWSQSVTNVHYLEPKVSGKIRAKGCNEVKYLSRVGKLQHGLRLLLAGVLQDDDGVLARGILQYRITLDNPSDFGSVQVSYKHVFQN